MENKCLFCHGTYELQKPPVDADIIGYIPTLDKKSGTVFPDRGLGCEVYACNNCGNIQLKAVKK